MPCPNDIRTAEQARKALDFAGVSVSSWAKANGFKPSTVTAVLRGNLTARIGESHKVAVALRLKPGVIVRDPSEVR